jgi:hypothetical protein
MKYPVNPAGRSRLRQFEVTFRFNAQAVARAHRRSVTDPKTENESAVAINMGSYRLPGCQFRMTVIGGTLPASTTVFIRNRVASGVITNCWK